MKFEIHSKGLYTTWINLPEANCAFDCGEGLASHMGPRAFGIQNLFISHDHTDHVAGLIALIGIRSVGFGDKDTPLNIFYPAGSKVIPEIHAFIKKTQMPPSYPLIWHAIEPGYEIPLPGYEKNPRIIRAFPVIHGNAPKGLTLGFSMIETRKRLKPEYQSLPQSKLKELAQSSTVLTQSYRKNLFSYSGDAFSCPPEEIQNTNVLVHDCTFIKKEDRDAGSRSHCSLPELIQITRKTNPKKVYAAHISPRYKKEDLLDQQAELHKHNLPITLVAPNRPMTFETTPQPTKTPSLDLEPCRQE